jgi:FixJ family two-component response regulator
MTIAQATVFIVDDDASVRKSLTRLIRAAGWNVESFSSGLDFLARLPYTGPGCVILDMAMPDIAGTELHDQMTARDLSLPVIFLTVDDKAISSQHPASAPPSGSVDFLTKPVDAGSLISAVWRALERHEIGIQDS